MPRSTPVNGAPAPAASPPPPAGDRPRVEALLWDLDQAAAALNLSTRTVKRMAKGGELPGVVKLGRRRLFSRKALEAWIGEGCPPVAKGKGRR